MRSTHSKNGYEEMYRTLVFTKRAVDEEYEHPRRGGLLSTKGLLLGGLTGAQVGGAAGLGTGLYQIGKDRRRIIEQLEAALKDRSLNFGAAPTIPASALPDYISEMPKVVKQEIKEIPGTYKDVFVKGRVHPGAEHIYGLKPEELKHLEDLMGTKGVSDIRGTVPRVESALKRMKGLKGFGRYALSRGGVPLLSAMHAGGPGLLAGAALGALFASRGGE